jgi:hypothetical protein
MTDIVERLRDYDPTRANSREAADEIERLTQQNADLRRWRALDKPITAAMKIVSNEMRELRTENERLRLRVKFLEDELKCPSALEPKP